MVSWKAFLRSAKYSNIANHKGYWKIFKESARRTSKVKIIAFAIRL